ncbi:dUTP diphosphatase [Mariprofundus sp. EBB-1]|uniref:dUTP diphosphatase n=1 Tax=Mariprofundus sp. EBB-1 TaxID=2650971 RepID=UPI000EF23743|nr:dUTP diphosphatase [Mariprofundus sp. EBB-1]RLL56007.1 dUTP diphosphatase [Mariprofundus sp. EBB-1]
MSFQSPHHSNSDQQHPTVHIQALPHGKGIDLPFYATTHAAGADLRAAIDEDVIIEPGQHVLIKTGFAMALPDNFEAQIRPRSGLALKHGITVLNAPGTIDADYRGEIGIILINHGDLPFTVQRGDRIAQMVIAPFVQADFMAVGTLSETERGEGGFGSSGKQ